MCKEFFPIQPSILLTKYKIFRYIIEARHLNTHRGIFDDKEKNDLNISKSIYEQYEVLGLEIDDEYKQFMPEIFLDWKIKEYRKDRLKWAKNAIKIVEDHVRNFFDSLIDEFISKKMNIKDISGKILSPCLSRLHLTFLIDSVYL